MGVGISGELRFFFFADGFELSMLEVEVERV